MKEKLNNDDAENIFDLRNVRIGFIPVGKMLEPTSRLSFDRETQNGVREAKEILKKKGLFILDAHYGRLDVLGTGINMARELNFKTCIVPSSFVNLERPILTKFYKALREQGIALLPTYRKSSIVPEKERKKVEEMPEEEVLMKNNIWKVKTRQVLPLPGSVVFIAVYGGMNKPGGYIPYGTEEVLKIGNPALCTLTVYNKRSFVPMTTYTSGECLVFDEKSSNHDMYEKILAEHRKIAGRAGFDPDYFKS